MITRSLTAEEFGAFSLILSIVGYFLISETIISYWATRHIARGEDLGRTAVLSSAGMAGIGLPAYIVYVFFISQGSGVPFEVLVLGLVLIPVNYVSVTLAGINLGHKPHATSYSMFIFDTIKIVAGAVMILALQWDVFGAIMTILAAFICKIVFQAYVAKPKLKAAFKPSVVVEWIKASWLTIFAHMQNYIQLLDMVLYSVITGSVLGVAYYSAAYVIAKIVSHAGAIAQAIYPKMLANQQFEGVTKNYELLLYFAVPMMAITVIFAEVGLFVLNPLYRDAWPAVILLGAKHFVQTMRVIPLSILSGTERADTESMSFSRLARSNLLKVPLALSVFNVVYISALVVLLTLFDSNADEFELVTWWAAVGLVVDIAISSFICRKAYRIVQFSIRWRRVLKFVLAAGALMGVFYVTSGYLIVYDPNIYRLLPMVTAQMTLCAVTYLGVTYMIDKESRSLFKAVLRGLSRIMK